MFFFLFLSNSIIKIFLVKFVLSIFKKLFILIIFNWFRLWLLMLILSIFLFINFILCILIVILSLEHTSLTITAHKWSWLEIFRFSKILIVNDLSRVWNKPERLWTLYEWIFVSYDLTISRIHFLIQIKRIIKLVLNVVTGS